MSGRRKEDILVRVRERLTPVSAWTQGRMAEDVHGGLVASTDPEASRWCMLGALRAECATHGEWLQPILEELLMQLQLHGVMSVGIAEFNDMSTHAGVLQLLDDTIERLRGEPRG